MVYDSWFPLSWVGILRPLLLFSMSGDRNICDYLLFKTHLFFIFLITHYSISFSVKPNDTGYCRIIFSYIPIRLIRFVSRVVTLSGSGWLLVPFKSTSVVLYIPMPIQFTPVCHVVRLVLLHLKSHKLIWCYRSVLSKDSFIVTFSYLDKPDYLIYRFDT